MPHIAFLALAALLGTRGWMLHKQPDASSRRRAGRAPAQAITRRRIAAAEASWDDVSMVDQLGLEVGYRLIPLVDHAQNGELLHRIRSLRKKFAQDVGFLPPVVHIRDNLELQAQRLPHPARPGWRSAGGVAMPGQWLAIDPGGVSHPLKGTPTHRSGLRPAGRLDRRLAARPGAGGGLHGGGRQHRGGHAPEPPDAPPRLASLLGRQEVQQLLDRIAPRRAQAGRGPGAQDACRSTSLQKVLQGLLAEEVPIRDMRTIIGHHVRDTRRACRRGATATGGQPDVGELIALVRRALGRAITQQWFPGEGEVRVIGAGRQAGTRAVAGHGDVSGVLEPGLADTLLRETRAAVRGRQEAPGQRARPGGVAAAAAAAVAVPAPPRAATRRAGQYRNSG